MGWLDKYQDGGDVNFDSVQRAVRNVESLDGKLMWNPESTATGLYGQLFSQVKDDYSGTRKEFAKDTIAQKEFFKNRFFEGLPSTQTTPLVQDANDIYNEYASQIPNFNYSREDLAILSNFLGRQGTREYLGYHVRDNQPLEEALPNIYRSDAKQRNKTPEQYLEQARKYYKEGGDVEKAQYGKILKWGKELYDGVKGAKKLDNVVDAVKVSEKSLNINTPILNVAIDNANQAGEIGPRIIEQLDGAGEHLGYSRRYLPSNDLTSTVTHQTEDLTGHDLNTLYPNSFFHGTPNIIDTPIIDNIEELKKMQKESGKSNVPGFYATGDPNYAKVYLGWINSQTVPGGASGVYEAMKEAGTNTQLYNFTLKPTAKIKPWTQGDQSITNVSIEDRDELIKEGYDGLFGSNKVSGKPELVILNKDAIVNFKRTTKAEWNPDDAFHGVNRGVNSQTNPPIWYGGGYTGLPDIDNLDLQKLFDAGVKKQREGGWLDKFAMGGSLPGASGMMYSRNSGSSAMSPPNLTKAQDGDKYTIVPEDGIELDEVVITGKSNKRKKKDEIRKELFKDMPDYLRYGDDDYTLSAEKQQQLDDLGITDLDSYNEYFGTSYDRENAGNEFNYLNYYKPAADDMRNSIHAATNTAARNIITAASYIPIVRGASVATKVPQAFRYVANSPVGRAAVKYVGKPVQNVLNYKPFGGPVSISNIMDVGSAAYSAYATPEAYDKFKENPSFDTGLDLALTSVDLVPFGEIFTGGKNIRRAYNYTSDAFTNTLKSNPSNYYRGIGQGGLDDVLETGLLRAKPSDQIAPAMSGPFDLAKRFDNLYVTPNLNVANRYGKGVVAEIPRDAASFSQRYAGKNWSMLTDNQIPIENINLYKKNFFGNYRPVEVPSSSLSNMPWVKPNMWPTNNPLSPAMEPYLSRKVYPFNKEQEIFESFLPTEAQFKNINSKSIRYDADGNIIPNMEFGGEVPKAQVGLANKLYKFFKGADNVVDAVKVSNKFESAIDWAKWNKEIPNNKALMKEYNAIEQASKLDGTWMTDIDSNIFGDIQRIDLRDAIEFSETGLVRGKEATEGYKKIHKQLLTKLLKLKEEALGTPEQFVQRRSKNYKKAFPNDPLKTYRGAVGTETYNGPLDGKAKNLGSVFTTGKDEAIHYGSLDGNGLLELLYNQSDNSLDFSAKGSGWNGLRTDLIPESNLKSSISTRNTTTDDIASRIEDLGIDYVNIRNIYDGVQMPLETIFNHRKGNYLKSAIGNNGMFDMTNPNIYKAIVPGVIGLGAASQMTGPVQADGQFKNGGSLPQAQDGLPFGIKSQSFSDVYVPNIQWAENVQGLEWAKDKQQGMNVSGVNLSKDFNLGKNTSLSVSNPAFVHARPMVDGTQFGEANKFFPLDPKVTLRYRFNEGGSLPKAQYGINGEFPLPIRKGVRSNYDDQGNVVGESSHLMRTETLDGKNWFSFPTLFQDEDGTWIDMSEQSKQNWEPVYEEAKKRGEVIDFGTDEKGALEFGEGSWKSEMKHGGGVPKAQLGWLSKLYKMYKGTDKLVDAAKTTDKVVDAAKTTGKLKYMDELSPKAQENIYKQNYEALRKTDIETRKLGEPHIAQEEHGEGWKYSIFSASNTPEEVAAHRKRWIASQKKGNFLLDYRRFPLFDETGDIFSDLSRKDLLNAMRSGLDKPFSTIGNSYRTEYGHLGLDYEIDYLNDFLGKEATKDLFPRSIIRPDGFNSSDEAWTQLRENLQNDLGGYFYEQFKKPSKIDFGDLLENKNRNGGWLSKYENGGVIEDDRGQWAHPGEITKINSNNITMKGVNYPVLGISDTGDRKMMQPGKDYKFKGNSVTEFPMARDGKSLVELNQLTNFTNYNTPQPGGWLDKY